MTLAKYYSLYCNGCLRLFGDGRVICDTGREARASARKKGWKRTPGSASSGKDWCPRCAPEDAR